MTDGSPPERFEPSPEQTRILEAMLAELRKLTANLSPPGKLLSKREAARRLGVSRARTLDAMIQDGRIRAVAVGGRLKIPATEIERIAGEGTSAPAPEVSRARGAGTAARREHRAAQVAAALKRRGF